MWPLSLLCCGKLNPSYLRHNRNQLGCLFVFRDVSEGKWLFVANLQHHVAPYATTVFLGDHGPGVRGTHDLSELDMIWGAVDLSTQDNVVARQLVEDYRKRKDAGMFRVHDSGRQADVMEWTPDEAETWELGLSSPLNPGEGSHQ